MRYETAKAKADKLLAQGDALASIKPAESRKLLRRCMRYRLKARASKTFNRTSDVPNGLIMTGTKGKAKEG
jgi:hypothetical protein